MSATLFNPLPRWWGTLRAGTTDTRVKSYTLDLLSIGDIISSVSRVTITRQDGTPMTGADLVLEAAPALDLSMLNVTLDFGGGIPGAVYNVELVVTTLGGRTLPSDTLILVSGPPITNPNPVPALAAIMANLTATGTTQATAYAITAISSVFTNASAGAGVILPNSVVTALQLTVMNQSGADLLVYPPVGATIGMAAVNAPVTVSPGQIVTFTTQNPASQWFAA